MRNSFKIFILILFLISAFIFIVSSDLFSIKNISVTGNKTITKNDIISLSGLQFGQNIFRLNKKKIVKNILVSPKIKAVRIKRIIPSGVSLDLIEREAKAIIPYLGSYLNIDDEALIISVSGLDEKVDIPIIEGFSFNDFKIGEAIDIDNKEQLRVAMDILVKLANANLLKAIKLINIEDIENIELVTDTDIRIVLCDNKLDYKIQMAKSILEDLLKNEKRGIVDMRHDGNPIFKEYDWEVN